MSDPNLSDEMRGLEPVHEHEAERAIGRLDAAAGVFSARDGRRVDAQGLYHWSRICGIGVAESDALRPHSIAWQTATVFFAVIDLVAAVGLWLAAAWGAVIWLTSVASMLAVEIFFPQVFDGGLLTGIVEAALLAVYLWLALKSAQEQQP